MIETLAHGGEWSSPNHAFGGSRRSKARGGQPAALQAWQ
jgi:hypothetical protein